MDDNTKTLNVTSEGDARSKIADIETFGATDGWKLICKASSRSQRWMKATKAMEIEGIGCVVQTTTQQGDHVAEAIVFVPGVKIVEEISVDDPTHVIGRRLAPSPALVLDAAKLSANLLG